MRLSYVVHSIDFDQRASPEPLNGSGEALFVYTFTAHVMCPTTWNGTVRYLPINVFPHEVIDIPTSYRLDYQARNNIEIQCEISLLNNQYLNHLSVLPSPTVTKIEPEHIQLGIPAEGHAIPKGRPELAEIRSAVLSTIIEHSGLFINNYRISHGP